MVDSTIPNKKKGKNKNLRKIGKNTTEYSFVKI